MQIHILEDAGQELAAIDEATRRREAAIRRAQAIKPIDRLSLFAGWTLDETTRDLISPAGRRVDLTSSEFDLLMALIRQPSQPLSRGAVLGVGYVFCAAVSRIGDQDRSVGAPLLAPTRFAHFEGSSHA